jgi:YVTN family beta-propeller protein
VEPFDVVCDAAKGEIFVSNVAPKSEGGKTISVISDDTNTVTATIDVPGCQFLTYDSARDKLFVGGYDSANPNSYSIGIISDTSNTVIGTIDNIADNQVEGLAFDSSRGEIFVALHNSNKVVAISDNTNQVVSEFVVGDSPWGVTFDSGKNAIYVTNGRSNDVSVISEGGSGSTNPTVAGFTPNTADTGSFDWTLIIIIIIIVIVIIIIIILWLRKTPAFKITVQDEQTKKTIPNATVTAEGPSKLQGNTEGNGQVIFKDPEDGDYTVKATAAGYNPSAPIAVEVEGNTELTIKLTPIEGPPQTEPTPTQTPPNNPPPPPEQTQEPQNWKENKLEEIIQTFKNKGALTPQTALTAKELGLSRLFIRAMEKRRGQTKYIIETNGRYYLDQKALTETP